MKYSFLFIMLLSMTFGASGQKRKQVTPVPQKVIEIDFNQVKGPMSTMFKECIGAGRANEGLRADWQQQLAEVKKICDFKYIRMHGLLSDDMGVFSYDRQGKPVYNFQYIDVLYDYILSIGMKPFVELGFMPSALASGKETIFWWRGNVTPPKDYNQWADLIKALTQHYTERYGADEVKTWYFEVWNEPNLSPGFWSSTQAEYFKLYQYTVQAIKSVNKDYRVGGPATAGAGWVPEMIDFCVKNNLPLDYISTHSYGVRQGYLDEYGTTGTVLDKNKMSLSGDVLRSRSQIAHSSMPTLELHYTEWSASYTPADPIHDSYHEAPYILQKLKQVGDAPNSMSYWVFTDIFEEPGPRFTPFHGGFGLVNYQGIRKPAFYAYAFLNKLGNTELVNTDSTSWATRDNQGNVQLLFWDYTYTLPDSTNNQDFYIRDLPARSKGNIRVEMANVPAGSYMLEIYQTGYKVNDAYTSYYLLNRPSQLSRAEVDFIKKQNDGSPVSTELLTIGADGKFSREIPVRENDVFLVNLVRIK